MNVPAWAGVVVGSAVAGGLLLGLLAGFSVRAWNDIFRGVLAAME